MAAPTPVVAASVTFGTPQATSRFGSAITFEQPYEGSIAGAQIAMTTPGDAAQEVAAVEDVSSATLTYTLHPSPGGLTPFTPITAHFIAVLSDGSRVAGPEMNVVYADDRESWQSASSGLLTIHWYGGTSSFARQLLDYGVAGFAKAAKFYGITETKPVDFYVYSDQQAFSSALGTQETIGGQAMISYRVCFAQVNPGDYGYGRTVVPHELTHIAFADALSNPYHSPPRWLNEGLADYLSEGYSADNRQLVSRAARNGTLVPLAALAGYFALDESRVFLSYAEALSAVDFMVRKYGQPAIQKLIASYAAASTDDEAFQAAFGLDVAAFDKAWMADNGVSAPKKYGPQPAPTGPVPPGWSTGSGGSTASATPPPGGTTAQPSAAGTASGGNGDGNGTTTGGQSSTNDPTPLVLMLAAVLSGFGVLLLVLGISLQHRGPPTL